MSKIVEPSEAQSFVESVPDEKFQRADSGIYFALVNGPSGLTFVRKKYGQRMAIEARVVSQLIDELTSQFQPQIEVKH